MLEGRTSVVTENGLFPSEGRYDFLEALPGLFVMNFTDLAAFITFFLVVIGFSLWKSRKPKDGSQDGSDFFLGGRSLTWPIIGISMPHRADSRPSPTPTSFKGSPCSSAA